MRRLHQCSHVAQSRYDLFKILRELKAGMSSSLVIYQQLLDCQNYGLPHDILIPHTASDLSALLRSSFNVPIYLQGTAFLGKALAQSFEDLSLETFLTKVLANGTAECSIVDTAGPHQHTRKGTVEELRASFGQHSRGPKSPINVLEISNFTHRSYIPPVIAEVDLLTQIAIQNVRHLAKDSRPRSMPQAGQEWFLLSQEHSVSPAHIDVAGFCTVVIVVEGGKVWYPLSRPDENDRRHFAQCGSLVPEGFSNGWARILLERGDVLIMPPGTIHAVFTPEDCLCVGKHFYTAGTIGASLDAIRFMLNHEELINEDSPGNLYNLLTYITTNASSVLDPTQLRNFALALIEFARFEVPEKPLTSRKALLGFKKLSGELGPKLYRQALASPGKHLASPVLQTSRHVTPENQN
ncbi:MAG: hypothetical protein Q9198_010065 [Flavoplaca austrocitrina]